MRGAPGVDVRGGCHPASTARHDHNHELTEDGVLGIMMGSVEGEEVVDPGWVTEAVLNSNLELVSYVLLGCPTLHDVNFPAVSRKITHGAN